MGVWETKAGEIRKSFRTELHDVVLPLLRLRWRSMHLCRELQPLDCDGIDLVDVGEGDRFRCVVQCKGFDGHGGLDKSHLDQIEKSILSFETSSYSADTYVLLHTKDARSIKEEAIVADWLNELIKKGRIGEGLIWNRQTFISDCKYQMKEVLLKGMRDDSARRLQGQEHYFRFGSIRISPVPANRSVMEIDPVNGPTLPVLDSAILIEPSQFRRPPTRYVFHVSLAHLVAAKLLWHCKARRFLVARNGMSYSSRQTRFLSACLNPPQ